VLQLCYVDVSSQRLNKAKLVVVITDNGDNMYIYTQTDHQLQLSTFNCQRNWTYACFHQRIKHLKR